MSSANRALRILLGVLTLLLLAEPGYVPLFDPDEGRYAEIGREILATGDWLIPRFNGVPFLEKPPLQPWISAISLGIFGLEPFAARMPSKLAALVTLLAVFFFTRPRFGEKAALLSCTVLSASLFFFAFARINTLDSVLSCALVCSALAFAAFQDHEAKGDRNRAQRSLYLLHLACGAGILAKGLVGLILPGGAILLFVALTGRYRVLPRLFSPGPLLVFLAVAIPWHVLVALEEPAFLRYYVWNEQFARFFTNKHNRGEPFWFFLPIVAAGLLPFTFLAPALREVWPRTRKERAERGVETYLFCYAAFVLLFFSASTAKLVPYVGSLFPPAAILLGVGLSRREIGRERLLTGGFVVLLGAAVLTVAFTLSDVRDLGVVPHAVVAGIVLVLTGIAVLMARKNPLMVLGTGWAVFLATLLVTLPIIARQVTPHTFNEALVSRLRPGDEVLHLGSFYRTIPFHARRLTAAAAIGPVNELRFDAMSAHPSPLLITEAEFKRRWNGPGRVFAVVHFDRVPDFGSPASGLVRGTVIIQSPNERFTLIANPPAAR
ncbi:MAG: glycosyltransferase family 39 protein [Acidobacteria bacterium]|nr:glycosyltransferase family 39 protein [Acidobacteriota bacterium]